MDWKGFGEHVRAGRRQIGWSQRDLGAVVGLSRTHVSNVERGKARKIGYTKVESLQKLVGEWPAPDLSRGRMKAIAGRSIACSICDSGKAPLFQVFDVAGGRLRGSVFVHLDCLGEGE